MELIINILASVEIFVFLRRILQVEFAKSKIRLVSGCCVLIGARLLYTYCPDENIAMIFGNMLGSVAGAAIMMEGTIIRNILKYEFSLIYVCFLYMPFDLVLSILKNIINVSIAPDFEGIILCIMVICLMYLISIILKKHKHIVLWIQEIPSGYYLVSIIYGTAVGLLVTYINRLTAGVTGSILIFLQIIMMVVSAFMYVFGIGFALIDLLRKQHRRESELKEKYMYTLESYNTERERNEREVRRMKHDMNTHIKVLTEMADKKDISEIKGYLADIGGHYDTSGCKFVNTGNVYINSILVAAMQDAKDINFSCEGRFPDDACISSFALCTIFSNLLSNSIEACRRLGKKERLIYIKIDRNETGWLLSFENPIEESIDTAELGNRYTSKKDKKEHGFGLYNVKRIVEENNGMMEIEIKDEMFMVSVFIQNNE